MKPGDYIVYNLIIVVANHFCSNQSPSPLVHTHTHMTRTRHTHTHARTHTVERAVDGEQYNVNHHFNCDSKCVVYFLTCKVCKMWVRRHKFRLRWNNYKACQNKAVSDRIHAQRYFHSHFLQENHNGLITDCDIVIIDKTDPAEPTIREMY